MGVLLLKDRGIVVNAAILGCVVPGEKGQKGTHA
jgi:hypothetical protein